MILKQTIVLPAEWEKQSFIQLTWPHAATDWCDILEEVEACYVQIALAILRYEPLLVVCADKESVRRKIVAEEEKQRDMAAAIESRLFLYEIPSNDTWARDHGAISVRIDGEPCLYDFGFNAWGEKFAYDLDNQITSKLFKAGAFQGRSYIDKLRFILEGGSFESDGQGTLLTTESCLLSEHRNEPMDKAAIESYLKDVFGLQRVLWLKHSYLQGDDTDGHVDMLARFCSPSMIAYVSVADGFVSEGMADETQINALRAMEQELRAFRQPDGQPYQLLPLPFPDAQYDDGERLPASYANFLILNHAVLVPIYNQSQDTLALSQIRKAFPDREVTGVDCRVLIRQHGSLHCSTMQYPL